jgi:hypothetical protein
MTPSQTLTVQDQEKIDAFDREKWKRVANLRPGDTVVVQGIKACGRIGDAVQTQVLNACLTASGKGDQVLVATSAYGRKWFGGDGSSFRVLSVVARTS